MWRERGPVEERLCTNYAAVRNRLMDVPHPEPEIAVPRCKGRLGGEAWSEPQLEEMPFTDLDRTVHALCLVQAAPPYIHKALTVRRACAEAWDMLSQHGSTVIGRHFGGRDHTNVILARGK